MVSHLADNGPLYDKAWHEATEDPAVKQRVARGIMAAREAMHGTVESEDAGVESIEEFAARVSDERQAALAASGISNSSETDPALSDIAEPTPPIPRRTREGFKDGAFGGALRRRIDVGNITETDRATISNTSFDAVSTMTLRRELSSNIGDQTHRHVLFSPDEFSSLTFAADKLAQRTGSQVLKGTVGRHQDSRTQRRDEVVSSTLQDRLEKIENLIASLNTDKEMASRLLHEMKTPGYAHMDGAAMDQHMAHVEGMVKHLVEAVASNRSASKEQLQNIKAALDYKLGDPSYRDAFENWESLSRLVLEWTNRKLKIVTYMRTDLVAEIEKRP